MIELNILQRFNNHNNTMFEWSLEYGDFISELMCGRSVCRYEISPDYFYEFLFNSEDAWLLSKISISDIDIIIFSIK